MIQTGQGFSNPLQNRRPQAPIAFMPPAGSISHTPPVIDNVRFTAIDPKLMPPTRTFSVQTKNLKTLQLRQWRQPFETFQKASAKKGPAFLFVHGLSGRTEWMSPLVQELMKKPLAGKLAFYGLDIPQVGQHFFGEGEVRRWSELVNQVKEAARYIKEKHGGLVHPVALSLGGLLSSQAMAEDPAPFGSAAIIAPAYRPHEDLVSVRAFRKAFTRFIRDRVCRLKDHEAIPFRPKSPEVFDRTEQDGFTKLQLAIHKEKETVKDRVEKLTLMSYVKMLKFMYDFRTTTLPNLSHRIRLFATDTDNLIDTEYIKTAMNRLPAGKQNKLTIYKNAAHDLINDPVNPQIATEIESMLKEQKSLR